MMSEIPAPTEYLPEYEKLSDFDLAWALASIGFKLKEEGLSDSDISRFYAAMAIAAQRFMSEHLGDEEGKCTDNP